MCLSVCVSAAAGQEFNKPASVTPIPISLPLSLFLSHSARFATFIIYFYLYTIYLFAATTSRAYESPSICLP